MPEAAPCRHRTGGTTGTPGLTAGYSELMRTPERLSSLHRECAGQERPAIGSGWSDDGTAEVLTGPAHELLGDDVAGGQQQEELHLREWFPGGVEQRTGEAGSGNPG